MTSPPQLPSNRHFGLLFAGVFVLLAGYMAYRGAHAAVASALLLAAVVVTTLSLVAPRWLTPFNKAWYRLGELLGRIVSPIVLGIIFFVLITPTGVITRLFGRDELRLKKTAVDSYWADRDPPGPAGDTFQNQF